MNQIKICGEHITLGKLLKVAGIVDTGGQAKYYIIDGRVKVNGKIINQRGKKVYPGDKVDIEGKETLSITD